jgi:hypothetical protein
MTEMYWEWLTRVARTGAGDDLRTGLLERMASSPSFRGDPRDLLMVLAPVHHCACAIGVDVVALFDAAADRAPANLAALVRDFGRHDHGAPGAFGFAVQETPDGPRYLNPGARA